MAQSIRLGSIMKDYKEYRNIGLKLRDKYNLGPNYKVEVFNTYIHIIRTRKIKLLVGFKPNSAQPAYKMQTIPITETHYIPFKEGIRHIIVEDE